MEAATKAGIALDEFRKSHLEYTKGKANMATFLVAIAIAAAAMAISLAMLAESRREKSGSMHGKDWAIIDHEFVEFKGESR